MFKFLYESSPASIRRCLNLAGVGILLVGLATAVLIWRNSTSEQLSVLDPNSNPAAPLAPIDSAKQSRQIEIYYGKTGLLYERWRENAQVLLHGRSLARLIAITSLMAASGCFLVARKIQV